MAVPKTETTHSINNHGHELVRKSVAKATTATRPSSTMRSTTTATAAPLWDSPTSTLKLDQSLRRSSLKKQTPAVSTTASTTTPGRRRRSSLKSSSNKSSSNASLNKSVSFVKTVKVKETLSHKDMTDDEKNDMWLQQHEANNIRTRCKKLVQTIERFGEYVGNGKKICTRGLESYIRKHAIPKFNNRSDAREEVLYVQDDQYEKGYSCELEIAEAYHSVTYQCQKEAELRASFDRAEIEDYMSDLRL
jgi:hypothetical protein